MNDKIYSVQIDRYVCDSCDYPLTADNGTFAVIASYAVRYEYGLYCPLCAAKLVGYRQKACEKPESPVRVYLLGETIDDLSRESCISVIEEFDPEENR